MRRRSSAIGVGESGTRAGGTPSRCRRDALLIGPGPSWRRLRGRLQPAGDAADEFDRVERRVDQARLQDGGRKEICWRNADPKRVPDRLSASEARTQHKSRSRARYPCVLARPPFIDDLWARSVSGDAVNRVDGTDRPRPGRLVDVIRPSGAGYHSAARRDATPFRNLVSNE